MKFGKTIKPHYCSEGRRVVFLVDVGHYLDTIEIAANKGVRIFIYLREIRRGKKWHYLHTLEIAANKGFRIFI